MVGEGLSPPLSKDYCLYEALFGMAKEKEKLLCLRGQL